MRILVLGGDGYLGWPTAMRLAMGGHDVAVVDNYLRRRLAMETRSEALFANPDLADRAAIFEAVSGKRIAVHTFDCADGARLSDLVRVFGPEAVIHYAEQPSAPYSMIGEHEARLTLQNNLNSTFNLIWAVLNHAPQCHIVKLGTMGEYGTPDIDIEEGWLTVEHKGRSEKFLYPRAGGSLYHTTKILDTDLLWFYVRLYGLRVTDLMQGPVYGLATPETDMDPRLAPNFHYDDIFGTVINRFLTQAAAGIPLTVYGRGGQTRGYLNLLDTLQCVELALSNPAPRGELRIYNQFTELFSIRDIAEKTLRAAALTGLTASVQSLPNPRKEKEEHYYNVEHSALLNLGLQPCLLSDERLAEMLTRVLAHKDRIDAAKILPRVRWNNAAG
ncbi:MAG TPA: NAD-dependent epimerase/dehydratase family protein [Azospirillaceae bacterium]|nr:NAD-dependent epimerase/dehydratase family protein [Azospirillaceae bacterium]HRQ83104.1 NAD-dependent epimerase/dehydratase family protein [Azospirillaceae bacterium]